MGSELVSLRQQERQQATCAIAADHSHPLPFSLCLIFHSFFLSVFLVSCVHLPGFVSPSLCAG